MKKQIMLKMLITSSIFSTSILAGSLSSKEIVDMVSNIKKERQGISLAVLESTENPFIIKIPPKEPTKVQEPGTPVVAETVYTLKAILNKAAFIGGKWYKQGDKLGSYKVGHVSASSVVLRSKNGNKTLSLKKKKKNFIKLNRGSK